MKRPSPKGRILASVSVPVPFLMGGCPKGSYDSMLKGSNLLLITRYSSLRHFIPSSLDYSVTPSLFYLLASPIHILYPGILHRPCRPSSCLRLRVGTMQISTNDFKTGLKVLYNNAVWEVVEFQHVKPGKGQAFVKTRLKNMATGQVLDVNFRAGEMVDVADVEERPMQFLYRQGEDYVFMDLETYDQVLATAAQVGNAARFLKEGIEVTMFLYEGRPLSLVLPKAVSLRVVRTDPGVRGDTAAGGSKPAVLETGAVVQVPLFIQEGEEVLIDTRTGEYLGRG